MKYEFLDHTADIKIRAYGKTLEEAYSSLIEAFANHLGKGEKISPKRGKVINVAGDDQKSLLYNFLDELIYLLDAENFLVAKGEVFFRGNNLKAELYGDDSSKYKSLDYIKAATYSEMQIEKNDNGYVIQVVLDV